jgi:hypothetical protein
MHNSALRKQKMHIILQIILMREEKFHLKEKLHIILNLNHIRFSLHGKMVAVVTVKMGAQEVVNAQILQ